MQFELTLRTVPAVIDNAKDGLSELITGWTVKECDGVWLGEAEKSIEFSSVTNSEYLAIQVKDYINFIAWQLGEESIMWTVKESSWTFTDCKLDYEKVK